MEHINARHLLTSSIAMSEPMTNENFVKLCRIYGRINPEESHVVLFYIPQYVRDGVRMETAEMCHVKSVRELRLKNILERMRQVEDRFKNMREEREKSKQKQS